MGTTTAHKIVDGTVSLLDIIDKSMEVSTHESIQDILTNELEKIGNKVTFTFKDDSQILIYFRNKLAPNILISHKHIYRQYYKRIRKDGNNNS